MTARQEHFDRCRIWARGVKRATDETACDFGTWCVAEGHLPSEASWLRFTCSMPASMIHFWLPPGEICSRCGNAAGYFVITEELHLSRLCSPCILFVALHEPLAIVGAGEFYPQ